MEQDRDSGCARADHFADHFADPYPETDQWESFWEAAESAGRK
jgi:hypothetical protein